MRSRVVMILAQVTLAQDDKVIQAFAADRADQLFNIGFCQDDRAAAMASDAHRSNCDDERPDRTTCPGPAAPTKS